MNNMGYVIYLALVLSLELLGGSMVTAQQGELSVARSPVQPSGILQLVVNAKFVDALGAGQLDVVFNPEHLEFKDAAVGGLLSSALFESNLVENGRVRIAFASSEAVSGEGVLLVVDFTPHGVSVDSLKFELENVSAWKSSDSSELVIQASGGTIRLNESASVKLSSTEGQIASSGADLPGWVYFVGGAGLSLIIVLLVLVLQRRK